MVLLVFKPSRLPHPPYKGGTFEQAEAGAQSFLELESNSTWGLAQSLCEPR